MASERAGGGGDATVRAFLHGRIVTMDLVVLDRDLFATPPNEIGDAEVVLTISDGQIEYRSTDHDA